MKRTSGNVLIIVLILAVVVGLGITGFFVWKNKTTPSPKTYEECAKLPGSKILTMYPTVCITSYGQKFTQPLTDEKKKNLQPPNEMANWKTYENKKLGFSINVPQNEIITESPTDSDWIWIRLDSLDLMIANSPPSIGDPAFKKEAKRQTIKLSDGTTLQVILSRRGVTPFEKDGFSNTDEIYIEKNGSFTSKYYVDAKPTHLTSDDKFNRIIQILSTFKFLDQSPEGTFCGGIAGKPCATGYSCKLDGNYPDAGGKCIKN